MAGSIGRYSLLRSLGKVEEAEEHLASYDDGKDVRALCRIWLPEPGEIEDPEAAVDQLSPLLALEHPNLTNVIDVFTAEQGFYLCYDYVSGRSLADLFEAHRARRGLFPVSLGTHVVMEVLEGLKYALSLGPSPVWWTHGALRPEVIEVTIDGHVRTRHLGLARVLLKASGGAGGPAAETLRKLAPAVDARAVATMLRELVQPIKQKIPTRLARVLSHALSPDASRRFTDAGALLDALGAASETAWEPWPPERIEKLLLDLFGEELERERKQVEAFRLVGAEERESGSVRKSSYKQSYIPDRSGTVPPSGAVIGDRYQVIRELGQGGVGVVLEVEHLELGTRAALKMLDPDVSRDPQHVERFKREARAASKIGHPNIVRVVDLGRTEDGRFFYVMDLIRGENLGKIIGITGGLDQARAVRIILQLCDALEAAHLMNVVHRDLKPENLMISNGPEGRDVVGVVDFGLSLSLDPKEKRLTQQGYALGTPYYMAPEQIAGKGADVRTDVYSAGAILYEMLTGRAPFEEETVAEVLTAHLRTPPVPPRLRAPHRHIAPALEAVVLKALSKEPEQRYQTMSAMSQAIRQAAQVGPVRVKLSPAPPITHFIPHAPAIPAPPMAGVDPVGLADAPDHPSPPPPVPHPFALAGGTTPPVPEPLPYSEFDPAPEAGPLPDPFDEEADTLPPPAAPTSPAPPPPGPNADAMADLSDEVTALDDDDLVEPPAGSLARRQVILGAAVLTVLLGAGIGLWVYSATDEESPSRVISLAATGPSTSTPTSNVDPGELSVADTGGAVSVTVDPVHDAGPTEPIASLGDGAAESDGAEGSSGGDGGSGPEPDDPGGSATGQPLGPEPDDPGGSATGQPLGPATDELFEQAQSLLKQGRAAQAAPMFQRVVRRSPSKAAAWAGLGQAQFEMGQHQAAARTLERAVQLNPRSVRYRLSLANALLRSGQRDKARNEYREVLRIDPDNAAARRILGSEGRGP